MRNDPIPEYEPTQVVGEIPEELRDLPAPNTPDPVRVQHSGCHTCTVCNLANVVLVFTGILAACVAVATHVAAAWLVMSLSVGLMVVVLYAKYIHVRWHL